MWRSRGWTKIRFGNHTPAVSEFRNFNEAHTQRRLDSFPLRRNFDASYGASFPKLVNWRLTSLKLYQTCRFEFTKGTLKHAMECAKWLRSHAKFTAQTRPIICNSISYQQQNCCRRQRSSMNEG